jgi:hypothetical protein
MPGVVPAFSEALPNLCGFYAIRVAPRRKDLVAPGDECDLSEYSVSGRFSRVDSDTSLAEVTVFLDERGCCDCLPQAWRDELIIERVDVNGQAEGVIWRGIITQTIEDSIGDG